MSQEPAFEVPRDRHYDRVRHLWVQELDNGRLRVGIDAMGLDALGELAFVSLHEEGAEITRGEPMGTLEAAKMTSSIVAPLSGRLACRNEAVLQNPLLVNRDPYGDGWLMEIDPSHWARESAELVSGDEIPAWVAAEAERWSGA